MGPLVFLLCHQPRLGAEEASNLRTPMGTDQKSPTNAALSDKGSGQIPPCGTGSDRQNCPTPPRPPTQQRPGGSHDSPSLSPYRVRENMRRLDFHPTCNRVGEVPISPCWGIRGGPVESQDFRSPYPALSLEPGRGNRGLEGNLRWRSPPLTEWHE